MHSNAGFLSQAFVDWQKSQPSRQTTAGRHEVEGFTFFREPYEDFGDYIRRLDAELHDRWIRPRHERGGTGYGIPWRERHRRVVDAGGPLPTTDDWADQVDYAVEIAGDSNVGIGLDLMSGPNLLDFDATSYPRLTEALVKKGYSAERIKKILGENWLRALDAAKAP